MVSSGSIKISNLCFTDTQPENKCLPNKVFKNTRLGIKL